MKRSEERFRLCTTVVTAAPCKATAGNEGRVEIARQVISRNDDVQLVALPAGFLHARDEREVRAVVAPVIAAAKKADVAVLVGVDTTGRGSVRSGTLPHFVVGWAPGQRQPVVWRQRSSTSADAGDAPEEAISEPRVLSVAGRSVAPIIDGEVFNPRVREAIAKLKPSVAVLTAHSAGGARHWAGQRSLAQLGVPSVRTVHAREARDYLCNAKGDSAPYDLDSGEGYLASRHEVG